MYRNGLKTLSKYLSLSVNAWEEMQEYSQKRQQTPEEMAAILKEFAEAKNAYHAERQGNMWKEARRAHEKLFPGANHMEFDATMLVLVVEHIGIRSNEYA